MDVVVLLLLTIFSVKGQMTSSDYDEGCPSITVDLSRSPVTASSTCGDDNFSQYCYVNSTDQTMQCRTCEHEEEARASNVVDSDANSQWISRPGLEAVNLTVDLIQPFRVTFMNLKTSKSLSRSLPARWDIHKSIDNGASFVPWIYLVDSMSLCPEGVGNVPNENQIACYETSEVMNDENHAIVSLSNSLSELSECGGYKTELLRGYSYATHIRLVFLTNSERGENASQLFYAITSFDIEGFCVCNGHANQCTVNDTGLYHCDCLNGTCGQYCDHCCPLYNNAPYSAHGRGCVECNCSGHADSCEYNETLGMGVCISCKNNTMGINCEQCLPLYYHHSVSKLCLPCQCNKDGIIDDGQCDNMGQCNCKEGYVFGLECNPCGNGTFHDGGRCDECKCPTNSSGVPLSCDPFSGQCACPPNTTGLRCDKCVDDTWDLDVDQGCKPCNCDVMGANGTKCDNSTGQCNCRDGYAGIDCSQCGDVYYWDDSKCVPCNCHTEGSWNLNCNSSTGQCACKDHVEGRVCSQCEEGYYNLTADNNGCLACSCDVIGSTSPVCDNVTGQCDCEVERTGRICKDCNAGYYIDTQTASCQSCACSQYGSISTSCHEDGRCSCKNGVVGKQCDTCAIGYWGFSASGCNECDCYYDGADRARICDPINGQCVCAEGISGPRCTLCEGLTHFIIENVTCVACGNCSQNLIDRLLLLVGNIISTINFLSDIDVVQNYNQFDQLRNEASAVMREVMQWSISVNDSLCRVGINGYCQPMMGTHSILRNYTTLSILVEELESFFPKLIEDVNGIVKLTDQTYYAIVLFETNVTMAHSDTKAVLNKTTEVLSEVTELLMNVEQLLNDSEVALATIIKQSAHSNNISNIVDQALDDARIRYNYSKPFIDNRTQENITVNNISSELKMLQLILQDLYALSSNVSLTVNNTLVYNRMLDDNITRLQAILNNTTTLNTTIGDMLNDTWVLYGDVYEMWEEAVLLLQNVTEIINVLNSINLPCAEDETESFKNWLDNLTDLAATAHNHSIRLQTDSLLIINDSSFWLQHGSDNLVNVSTLLSTINFIEIHSDINRTLDAAHDAITKIKEANLTGLNMSVGRLSDGSNLLSERARALSNEIQVRKNEAGIVQRNSTKFEENVEERQMDDTTFRNDINYLNDRVTKLSQDINGTQSYLSESEYLINRSMMVADQVMNKSLDVEDDIDDIRKHTQLTNSSLVEIDEISDNVTIYNNSIAISIDNLTTDIDRLINKNRNMISEIDAIIQGLYDIHQEINQMNGPLRLMAKDDKKPFISLQPPPGRPLTAATQYETIDLFLSSDEIENNTLLFYAGPAKAKDKENDEILQQGDYMALLSHTTRNNENELSLVYKLSGDTDVHQFSLRGSHFRPITDTRVHISRVGSTFTLAMKNNGDPLQQDTVSFNNGSLLFTGNNQTVFYIGGKPSDVELPSVVNSTSHYSGVVSLLLYNGQIWGLWNVRDGFSAGFTDDLESFSSQSSTNMFDRQFTLSFSADGYLYTEALFSRSGNLLEILIKPFSTEGLVMFAYDEQTRVSLEIHYRMGNLVVIFNGNESISMIESPPGEIIPVTILINGRSIVVQLSSFIDLITLSHPIMANFTKAKSWFGGINNDARHLGINQTKPFFGCIQLALDGRGISTDEDHFIRHYINSRVQKRLSLECLNRQYAHSASFNGTGRIEFDATSFSDDRIIENNKAFNSFSFEFVVDLNHSNNAGLLYASTKSGSLNIILYNHSIHVTLYDHNGGKNRYLNSSRQLELGRIHVLLLYLNYMDGYQLYIDDILEDDVDSFGNEWRLDLFTNTESPRLVLGAADDQEGLPYFKGCMKNLAIQFRTVSFLSDQSSGSQGVTYHTCNVLGSVQEQPLLAVAPAKPISDRCPPATMNFTTLSGIHSCDVPELTEDNFTIQAIPQRPNGLLLALANSTDLIYAIGTREGQGVYYAINRTEKFGNVCPSLITLNITSHDHIIMISGSVSVNVTQYGPVNLYIGGLPEDAVSDNRISFLQCDGCKCPPGFLGELEIQEIDLNYLVESTVHRNCKLSTQ